MSIKFNTAILFSIVRENPVVHSRPQNNKKPLTF